MIPYDQREGFIWMDGKLVEWKDAKVHFLNQGLHYGGCVFEGERAYGGKIFKLREHSARLIRSAELIGIKSPYTLEEIEQATLDAVKANNLTDAYIRPAMWRGSKVMGIAPQGNQIHFAVAAWYWPSYFSDEIRERGIKLAWSKWKRPSPETAPSESKAAGLYMICSMSKMEADAAGFEDALMLDYRGYVAEATGANIFFIYGDEIHTPKPDCFLNGITRLTVIDIAKSHGINVVERHIKPEEIASANEVFITGTAAEITPVGVIGENKYKVGDITRKLMAEYQKAVYA